MITKLRRDDVAEVVAVGKDLYTESNFKKRHWSDYKSTKFIEAFLANNPNLFNCIVKRDNKIVGIFFGYITEYFFGCDKLAQDLLFYVDPQYRGTSIAARLVKEFEQWASTQGAVEVCINQSTGVNTEKTKEFLERLGYASMGHTMKKDI